MPKKNGASRRDGCTMPVHYVFSGALVGGIVGVIIYPTSFPRALTEADAWDYFRVLSLKFRLFPASAAPSTFQAVGYVPGVQDTPPNSQGNVAELINSTVLSARQTTPTNWITVPRKELAGPFPWYKSIPGTADATEEEPGAIYVAGVTTDPYVLEVACVFEFKSSIATNNTPLPLQLAMREARVKAARERRRAEILTLLGPSARP